MKHGSVWLDASQLNWKRVPEKHKTKSQHTAPNRNNITKRTWSWKLGLAESPLWHRWKLWLMMWMWSLLNLLHEPTNKVNHSGLSIRTDSKGASLVQVCPECARTVGLMLAPWCLVWGLDCLMLDACCSMEHSSWFMVNGSWLMIYSSCSGFLVRGMVLGS